MAMPGMQQPPLGSRADRLIKTNLPVGVVPGHNLLPAPRPTHAFYFQFQNLGQLRIYSMNHATLPRRPSRLLASRNIRFTNIVWDDARAHVLQTTGTIDQPWQHDTLEPPFPLALSHLRDVAVYDHMVVNICGGAGNSFLFETMEDLYFFLLHIRHRRTAMLLVREIEILNMTEGAYVKAALQLLRSCTRLRRLTLNVCHRCHEIRAGYGGSGIWQAWMRYRVTPFIRQNVAANLIIQDRPNTTIDYCNRCRTMGATGGNAIGGPVSAAEVTAYARRVGGLTTAITRG